MILAVSSGLFIGLGCAIITGILFGAADFGAAEVGKKMSPLLLAATMYLFEVPILFSIAFSAREFGTTSDNVTLFLIGILGAIAFIGVIHGLPKGHVSIIMTLTGLLAIIVPAIVSVSIGENSSWLIWLGLFVSVIAIACITRVPEPADLLDRAAHSRAVKTAIIIGVVAGISFGFYGVGLGHIGGPTAIKLFILQLPGFIGALIYVCVKRPSLVPLKKYGYIAILMSLAYNIAQYLFPVASEKTSLIVTNIVVNLYPGVTIALSKIFADEKTNRTQHIGFAVAIGGLVLVSLGASS